MLHLAALLIPLLAQASLPQAGGPPPVLAGETVLVTGVLHRKCVATVESIPSPGFARLKFERSGCGDAAQTYELKHLQHLTLVPKSGDLSPGDQVTLKGHFGADCAGKVRELSRSGYVSVDLESRLCADSEALYKAKDLTKVSFVSASGELAVGQKVSTKGIREDDQCRGEISRLTSNGLAQIRFEQLTCADAGRLFPLSEVSVIKPASARPRVTGAHIFESVMREIASQKKSSRR